MAGWKIEYHQFAIPIPSRESALFGHGILVFRDSNNKIKHVYEGLAAGANGKTKPIGVLSTDEIRFDDFGDDWDYRLANTVGSPQVLFEGTQSEAERLSSIAKSVGDLINSKHIRYPPVGILSFYQKTS